MKDRVSLLRERHRSYYAMAVAAAANEKCSHVYELSCAMLNREIYRCVRCEESKIVDLKKAA